MRILSNLCANHPDVYMVAVVQSANREGGAAVRRADIRAAGRLPLRDERLDLPDQPRTGAIACKDRGTLG